MRLRVLSRNVEMRTQMMKLNHWIIERYAHEICEYSAQNSSIKNYLESQNGRQLRNIESNDFLLDIYTHYTDTFTEMVYLF